MFTILIAEDDLPLQKMMCAFLKLNGYQVLSAADGEEALNQISKVLPDLSIIDVMMPRMNGLELAHEIRSAYPLMPILMVTAKDSLEDKRAGFAGKSALRSPRRSSSFSLSCSPVPGKSSRVSS